MKDQIYNLKQLVITLWNKNEKVQTILLLVISSCVTFLAVEALNRNSLWKAILFGFQISNPALLTYAFLLLVNIFLYMIINRIEIAMLLTYIVFTVMAMISHYKVRFRGDPFLPTDLVSTKDAVNIMGNLNFAITFQVILAVLFMILMIVFWYKNQKQYKIHNKWFRVFGIVVTFSLMLVMVQNLYDTDYRENNGIKINLFRQNRTYNNNGFVLAFMINTQYLHVKQPEAYNQEIVENIISSAGIKQEYMKDDPKKKKPNIIFIMSETYSDLSYLADLGLDKPVTPFYNSLKQNTRKGKLNVPIIGAGTANTEFEVLTGYTTRFLPQGSMAYPQYIHKQTETILTQLKQYGYTNIANHPYGEKFWKRNEVYPLMGFDDFVSEEDYIEPIYRNKYISDESCYNELIKQYELYKDKGPLCMFNVTMQNHMPFSYGEGEEVFNVEKVIENEKLNGYLSGLNTSDKQLKRLIHYFEKADEDVMVVLFGDHLPALGDETYSELLETDFANIEGNENLIKQYQTPLLIWTNYDIKEKTNLNISSSFLGQYVLNMAGIELSPYFQFNHYLSKQFQAIHLKYAIDKKSNEYFLEMPEELTTLIKEYEIIQYDRLFGKNYFLDSLENQKNDP